MKRTISKAQAYESRKRQKEIKSRVRDKMQKLESNRKYKQKSRRRLQEKKKIDL